MSVLLPGGAARAGSLAVIALAREITELVSGGFQDPLGRVPGSALLHVAHQFRQALLVLRDVQAVDRLGEAQVRVDAGDDDPGVDGEHLDADQRDPHVGVDHHALVQDRVDNVGQSRWLRPPATPAGLHCRCHQPWPPCDVVLRPARAGRSPARPVRPARSARPLPPREAPAAPAGRPRRAAACRSPGSAVSSPAPPASPAPPGPACPAPPGPASPAYSRASAYSSRSGSPAYSSFPPGSRSSCSSSPGSRSSCSSVTAVSWSLTTSLSLISPRQPSTSSACSSTSVMTCRRKCFSSRRARRPWARQTLPVRSKRPCGWYSSTSSTRVRFGASSWKETAPSTCPFGPLDRQTMWLSGTCSTIVASQVRCDQKTCAFQLSFWSSAWSTFSTFFMNLGKSAN